MSDVIVVGAGQAGLATGRRLQEAGITFEILEGRNRPAGSWPDYYDSLSVFSPTAYSSLPGLAFPGPPKAYPGRDEVADYLETYAHHFALPVTLRTPVTEVAPQNEAWSVTTADGATRRARAVVVASGTFGAPHRPTIQGAEVFSGKVLHASQYRTPDTFKGGRVVVVGAANSAVQIAGELAEMARPSLAPREPVQYKPQHMLGQDIHFWARVLGLDNSNKLSDQGGAVLDTGKYRRAIAAGRPDQRRMFTRFTPQGVVWADGQEEAVDAVIFATGYRPHVPFLNGLPVWTPAGRLDQTDGVAHRAPGLYFMGQPGLRRFASATLRGVGGDAAVVVGHLQRHLAAVPA